MPTPDQARALCQQLLGIPVVHISRFPTGLCHHVYDVALADGRKVVVRIASAETRSELAGGIYWSSLLRPRDVPLPALLHADATAHPFAYMLLERLPGTDLGNVYPALSPNQKRSLADRLASIQTAVGLLPPGRGYGYVHHYDGPFPHSSWHDVLESQLARSRQWLAFPKIIDVPQVAQLAARLAQHEDYFRTIAPTPFLEDITTKNVLIADGVLSGIVDVDELCFGDPLYVLALTRMALLARGFSTDYIDYWKEALGVSARQSEILDLYTALHCLSFLGEMGQKFNQEAPPAVDTTQVARLLSILDNLLAR